jgi:Glycosyl transferase family 2
MDKAFFSVVLLVQSEMRGLERTVLSLQRQTNQNFEVIVQGAGSIGHSLDHLAQAGLPRVDIASEPTNMARAFNQALKHCRGSLIVPMTCGGWLETDALAALAQWYRENPHAAVYNGAVRVWRTETDAGSTVAPQHFELLSFMRGETCLTDARIYNRALVGDELHLNETLETNADFELLIRLGLRFSQAEFVRRHEVLLNITAADACDSNRTELTDTRVLARHRILESFFARQVQSPLTRRLRDACISSTYAQAAIALRDLTGETDQVRHYIRQAGRYRPDSVTVARLVAESSRLMMDPETGEVSECEPAQPAVRPRNAQKRTDLIDLKAVTTNRDCAAEYFAGADGARLRITTSSMPWSEAAQIPLRAAAGNWHWVEVSAQVHSGEVAVTASSGARQPKQEQVIGAGELETFTIVFPPEDAALVIRNASTFGSSVVDILNIDVYSFSVARSDIEDEAGKRQSVTHA